MKNEEHRTQNILGFAIALCSVFFVLHFTSAAAQVKSLDIPALLDAYAQGRHDDVVAAVHQANRNRIRTLRLELVRDGIRWVDRVPTDGRRVLVAATFALELERVRADRGDWHVTDPADCGGRCVLEWACALIRTRRIPDESARAWMLASIALVGGVRDWTFLQSPLAPPSQNTVERGHVHHALGRLPDEPRFRLARAIALSSRYSVTAEMDTPRAGERTSPATSTLDTLIVRAPALGGLLEQRRTGLFEYAKAELEALVTDGSVGDEARVRLGYLLRVRGNDEGALASERAVAEVTKNPDLRYVANFLAAQSAQALGDLPSAETFYRAALDARPHSQSATVGLAALLYVRGEGRQAYDLIEASRAGRQRDDDPWRLFLYGDFPRLPSLIGELRRMVSS